MTTPGAVVGHPMSSLPGSPMAYPSYPVGSYPSPYYVDGPGCCGPLGRDGRIVVPLSFGNDAPQQARLVVFVGGRVHLEEQVGTVEAAHDHARAAQIQPLDDLLAHRRRGRGGKRHHGRAAERAGGGVEQLVLGTEVVPPLRDAVRLIHRQQADRRTPRHG